MHRLEKTHTFNLSQDSYDKKSMTENEKTKRKLQQWRKSIRKKKKSRPGKFYKQSIQNISYFNKDVALTIGKKQVVDNIQYYWIKSPMTNLPNRFSRAELFALRSNFL